MTPNEALEILEEYGTEFEVSDSGFNDGSKMISHEKVFNNEREARQYIKALDTLIDYLTGEL
jgi:hypothetical protein